MSKKTKQELFNDEMFADIAAAKERAEIFPETQVVHLPPLWNDEVTEDSFKKHMDFANHHMLVLGGVVSEVAHEKYSELNANVWTGSTHLGASADLHVKHYVREEYAQDDLAPSEDNTNYGITDMAFTYHLNDEHVEFYDHFAKIDTERCKALFETKEE